MFESDVSYRKAIFYEIETSTWVGRPSPKSYEDSIFALSTFCTVIGTFRAGARALQSLINAYFAAIRAADTRENGLVEKVETARSCANFRSTSLRHFTR